MWSVDTRMRNRDSIFPSDCASCPSPLQRVHLCPPLPYPGNQIHCSIPAGRGWEARWEWPVGWKGGPTALFLPGMKKVTEGPPERIGPIPGLCKEAERNRQWWGSCLKTEKCPRDLCTFAPPLSSCSRNLVQFIRTLHLQYLVKLSHHPEVIASLSP